MVGFTSSGGFTGNISENNQNLTMATPDYIHKYYKRCDG